MSKSREIRTIFFTAFAVAVMLPGRVCYAQTNTTGDLTGTATDSSGAVVPNATVTLKGADTGEARTVTTGDAGAYRFTFLRPGRYQVSAKTPGLKSDIMENVNVGIGQVVTLNLILKPEEAKEIMTVTDAAPLLQVDNANIASTFSTQQIDLLPAPGGDMTSVAFTVPGVVMSTGGGYGNFSSHGLPGTANLFTLNGNDNMDPYLNLNNSGASNLTIGANEIAEASVVQNGYTGQYGRQAGAVVNFITKSGTNQFHGNLLYNYNGSFLNANDFFNNASETPRSRSVSNQYGASFGGPVLKNKLFFFVDTEGLRYVLPTAGVVTVPSLAFQNFVLGNITAAQRPYYSKAFGYYNNAPGHARARSVTNGDGSQQDSSGNLGCGDFGGTPAGGGKTFGVNVSCADAFGTNVSNQNSEWLFASRVDYNINDKQKIYLRFKTDHGIQPTSTSSIDPIFNAISNQPSYEGQITHTYVLTPRLVNNFIGSSSWYSAIFGPANLPATIAAFPSEFQFFDGGSNSGFFAQMGLGFDTFPQGRRVGQLQLVDDLSYTVGRHTLKAGVNYRYNRVTDTGNNVLVNGGRFRFFSMTDFANGTLDPTTGSSYVQRISQDPSVHLRVYNVGFYIQDEWAVSSNLRVTAALRFDHTSNPSCVDNCFARFVQPFETLDKGASIPYNQSIQTGLKNAFYGIESVVPQPRLGIVYNPGWSKNTVFRGGIGIFADQFPSFLAGSLFQNSPNVFTPTIRFGDVNSGGAGSSPSAFAQTASAFVSGFKSGATLAQLQKSLAPVAFTPPGYFSIPKTLNNPKFLEWSFEIQQQIASKNVFTVQYVGNHGYDVFLRNAKVNSFANPRTFPGGFGGLPTVVPDARFRIITALSNNGYTNYDGLSFQFRRGFGYGFQGQISYTWSHALDTVSNEGLSLFFSGDSLTTQNNPFNKSLNYSNADYDIRHNVTGDFFWEIPWAPHNGVMKQVIGGWTLSSKLYARTGTPFSVIDSSLPGKISNSTGGNVLATVLTSGIRTSCGHSAVDTPCFTSSQFAAPGAATTFGNLPRNSFRAPGYFDIDTSMYKTFHLGEKARLVLGASAFNLLNHPNFASPGGDVNGSGLGLITGTVSAPTSPYGSFQGSAVSGRVLVLTGKFQF